MILHKVSDPYALKAQEDTAADVSDTAMMVEYLAMMTNVELPSEDADSTYSNDLNMPEGD